MAGELTVGVLALQGGVREHAAVLERLGAGVVAVRRPADLNAIDALVIPGGESSVIDRLTRLVDLAEPLRERIGAGLPVLGTCAGLIMLADRIENPAPGQRSLGGLNVTVRRNAFGGQQESFDTAVTVTGVDGAVDASFIRAPIVVERGAGVEVIARVGDAVVGVRQGALWGVSFHPEVAGDTRVHAAFLASMIPAGP